MLFRRLTTQAAVRSFPNRSEELLALSVIAVVSFRDVTIRENVMRHGIEIIPFGEFANPKVVIQLARTAEAAGWEGLSIWDHVCVPYGVGDPWVLLTAAATATERLLLCSGVAPLPRYRVHVLSRLLASLDVLSQGRLIFGTGIGADEDEFTAFGEPGDPRVRAEILDEGLQVLTRLWSGQPVSFRGKHLIVKDIRQNPLPLQEPRIPIWIGGESKPALRRAANWDGWIVGTIDENCRVNKTAEQLAEEINYIQQHRTATTPFDVAINGASRPKETALIGDYEGAGVTWRFESLFGLRGSVEEMLARVQAGPPA